MNLTDELIKNITHAYGAVKELETALKRCAPWYCEKHCLPKQGKHTNECKEHYALLALSPPAE